MQVRTEVLESTFKNVKNDDILEMKNKLDRKKWNKIDRSRYFHSKQLERDQWEWDDIKCTTCTM